MRLERLTQILITMPAVSSDPSRDNVRRGLWRTCGGPIDEVDQLVQLLLELRLLRDDGSGRRTAEGDRVVRGARRGDLRPLGYTLVRGGFFHDQAGSLIEAGEVDGTGDLRCPLRDARRHCAQLIGVLQWWPDVRLRPDVHIPAELFGELNSIWALIPPPPELPAWAAERKAVGDRAEMYSVQWERQRVANASDIWWVARETDSLGWDIEDHSIDPTRCIEAKGRRDRDVVFFLSANEWNKAQELGPLYEIHFWGGISLDQDPVREYAELVDAGYPLVIQDASAELSSSRWVLEATQWRVRRAPSS